MPQESTTTSPKTSKVLIIDDHPLMREGLKRLINHEADLEVCGEAEDLRTGLRAITELLPDVVTLDLSLKGSHGLDLLKAIRKKNPKLPVLIITMHDQSLYSERTLRAGARGYVMKQEASEKVLDALRSVIKGEPYFSSRGTGRLIHLDQSKAFSKAKSPIETLSNRELQVFQLIGKGLGTRKIAENLGLSVKTIETNRSRIMNKLGLPGAIQLLHYAIQNVGD